MATIQTRLFGEIEIKEEKLLTFEDGIIGFPYMKHFMLIHDVEEKEQERHISWLQSIEEPTYALPVMSPLIVDETYNPTVESEWLKKIEPYKDEDIMVFTTLRVTTKLEEMTSNFKAPIIINVENRKACQIIIEDEKYLVKQPIYEALKEKKEGVGE